ncbi:MAG: (4Fe-4S)-binding protein [Vicinamibacterales bacterium]
MNDRVQSYETNELVVTFDPARCQHTGICLRGLGPVFDITRTRWIDLRAASADAVMAQVDACPSGALQYIRKA